MAGYTPIFDTVLDGTLFGKWPHTGIWVCLLSQCDRGGNIDVVPSLLAAKIGVPLELLLECIADFMKPDPGSRTGAMDGRRLELIDGASREWGWHVINHTTYRERARKSAYDKERTDSGKDAERKRKNRELETSREVPTRPAKSRAVPLSEAEANSKKETPEPATAGRGKPRPSKRAPVDFIPDASLALEKLPNVDVEAEITKFRDWEFKTPRSDWAAVWRNWVQTAKERNQYARKSGNAEWGRIT